MGRVGTDSLKVVMLRQHLDIEPMREGYVPVVQEIEKEIFSTPWPRNAYYRELASRNTAHYIVLRREAEIIGYGGMWRRGCGAPASARCVRRAPPGGAQRRRHS